MAALMDSTTMCMRVCVWVGVGVIVWVWMGVSVWV